MSNAEATLVVPSGRRVLVTCGGAVLAAFALIVAFVQPSSVAAELPPAVAYRYDLVALTFERLAERHATLDGLADDVRVLGSLAPELLLERRLTELAAVAFLEQPLPTDRGEDEITAARLDFERLGRFVASYSPRVRRALLRVFNEARLGEALEHHTAEAAAYFDRVVDHHKRSVDCMRDLSRLRAALEIHAAAHDGTPLTGDIAGVVTALDEAGCLAVPAPPPRLRACPLNGVPYAIRRAGGTCTIACRTHSTASGLIAALSVPFTLEEDRAWHERNAVVWARTVLDRRITRDDCGRNIERFVAALGEHRRRHGTVPEGTCLDIAERLIDDRLLPPDAAPLCPMNGAPLTIEELPPREATPGAFMISCSNHGRYCASAEERPDDRPPPATR